MDKMVSKITKVVTAIVTSVISSGLLVICVSPVLFLGFVMLYFADDNNKGEDKNYIDYDNSVTLSDGTNDGVSDVDNYSVANSACLGYYELLSDYTVLQECTENGKTSYIPLSHEKAKSDYFNRDKKMVIDPNILYSMNEKVFSYEYVYPEAFLKPVAHTDEFKLDLLLDDNYEVDVESDERDKEGKVVGDELSTADYGISALCTYKTLDIVTKLSGTYDRVLKINQETQEEELTTLDKPISFEIELKRQSEDVLDKSVSMRGSVTYAYNIVTTFATACEKGIKSDNPADNVEYIKVSEEKREIKVPVEKMMYVCKKKKSTKHFETIEEANAFLSENKGYTLSKDTSGNPVKEKVTVEETKIEVWDVYNCRSADSGVYVDSFTQGTDTKEESDNQYLYNYLARFKTYRPMVERTYETFRKLSTKASSTSYRSAAQSGSAADDGTGGNMTRQEYIESIAADVQADAEESGILPSITIAQACLESGDGKSKLAQPPNNNHFGMKASSQWINSGGKTVDMDTREEKADGSSYYVTATWCVFDDFAGSVRYHSQLLWNSKGNNGYRYRDVVGKTDYRECAQIIKDGGYATDNDYVDLLCGIIEDYNLTQYDTVTWSGQEPDYADSSYDASSYAATNSATSGMSAEDRETFFEFYHAVDNPYDGKKEVEPYTKQLSEDEVDEMLRVANTFTYQTAYATEESISHEDLLTMSLYNEARQKEVKKSSSYATGNDLVDIAMAEVGTKEEPLGSNVIKYNDWAGMQGSHWCNIFICWCADQLGYLDKIIPRSYGCANTADWYRNKGLYHERDSGYEPKIGDLICFLRDGGINHIGIVCGIYTDSNGDVYIETVEGNSNDQVYLRQKTDGYLSTNPKIDGYCEVPYE